LVLWCLTALSTIYKYIIAVSFIGGGNEWDQILSGRRDRMVVVFITTYAIGAYHH
jgi:hypothetical protein